MKIVRQLLLLMLLGVGLHAVHAQPIRTAFGHPESDAARDLEVPPHLDRVMDLASVLGPAQIDTLKGKSVFLQLATTTELGILIIPDLRGQGLEKYSLKVANTWKLGRCDLKNGVLILVALKDRALRIEVGLGLESILTNEACKRIIEEDMIPFFKAGDYFGGLDSGMTAIMKILTASQEYKNILSRPQKCSEDTGSVLNK